MKNILQYIDFVYESTGAITVYSYGEYRITINSQKEPTHLVLFYQDKKVGVLNCYITDKSFEFCDNKSYNFYVVNHVEIDKEHRNKGYGKMLYKILQEHRGDIKGLISHLPDRVNKKQIPSIYKNFKTITEGDSHVIIYDNSIITNENKHTKKDKEKFYYKCYYLNSSKKHKGVWITSKQKSLFGKNATIYQTPNTLNIIDKYKGSKFTKIIDEFGDKNIANELNDLFINFLISKGYDGIKSFDELLIFDENLLSKYY